MFLRNIALVLCAKPRNLHCELSITINAMISKTKSCSCAILHLVLLRKIAQSSLQFVLHNMRKKNHCAKFSEMNRNEKCHCVESLILISSIYKVVISVCPVIAQEPLDRFASNFDWGTRECGFEILS